MRTRNTQRSPLTSASRFAHAGRRALSNHANLTTVQTSAPPAPSRAYQPCHRMPPVPRARRPDHRVRNRHRAIRFERADVPSVRSSNTHAAPSRCDAARGADAPPGLSGPSSTLEPPGGGSPAPTRGSPPAGGPGPMALCRRRDARLGSRPHIVRSARLGVRPGPSCRPRRRGAPDTLSQRWCLA